jgi:hypothetical protein
MGIWTFSVPAEIQAQVQQYFGEPGRLVPQENGTMALIGTDGTVLAQETENRWEIDENTQVIAEKLGIELKPEWQYSVAEATTSYGTYNYLIDGFNGAKLARQENGLWVRVPEANVAEMYGHLLPETPRIPYEGKFGMIDSTQLGDAYHNRDASYTKFTISPILTGNWRESTQEVPKVGSVTEVALEGIFMDVHSQRVVKMWFGVGVPEVEALWWGFAFDTNFEPRKESFRGTVAEAVALLASPGIQIEALLFLDRPVSGWRPQLNPSAEECTQLGMTVCWHPYNVDHFMFLPLEAQIQQLIAEIRSDEGITSDFTNLVIPPYQLYAPLEVWEAWQAGGW